jgi:hypothetical protein
MLKVLAHTFGCWRFLFLFFDMKGYCSNFECSKFLLLFIDVKSSYSYSWILKVLTFVFGCWRFLFLLLDVEGFYFWMLRVLTFILGCWRLWLLVFCLFAYILKNDVKIYSILFRSWLYKFSLTCNHERFMKGVFLMIIMLHMFCFMFEHLWWLLLFLCYRAKLSLCFNPLTSKLCIQCNILSKAKIVVQFTWL